VSAFVRRLALIALAPWADPFGTGPQSHPHRQRFPDHLVGFFVGWLRWTQRVLVAARPGVQVSFDIGHGWHQSRVGCQAAGRSDPATVLLPSVPGVGAGGATAAIPALQTRPGLMTTNGRSTWQAALVSPVLARLCTTRRDDLFAKLQILGLDRLRRSARHQPGMIESGQEALAQL
jgi:hypothetical protein